MRLLTFLAKRFIAGETETDAIRAIQSLNQNGIKTTVDILGENVTNEDEAKAYADRYIHLLHTIQKTGVDSNVSIKPTMMGLNIDYKLCRDNIKRILDVAAEYENFVRIDMERSDYTQLTIDLCLESHKTYPKNIGVVIQSYLYRSKEDIKKLNEAKTRVRICKGAYKEPSEVAFQDKTKVNENFDKLAKMLLLNGKYPAIATHDIKRIEFIKNFVNGNGIDKSQFEFQMLYGIRRDLQKQLVSEGYNMRVYVPYGTAWFPYYFRRLRERKENLFFILKNLSL